MNKKLELIIKNTCHNCPYFETMAGGDYNEEYYYCWNPKLDLSDRWPTKTICEKPEIAEYEHAYRQYLDTKTTLFPLDVSTIPDNPANIPNWCPLPDIE